MSILVLVLEGKALICLVVNDPLPSGESELKDEGCIELKVLIMSPRNLQQKREAADFIINLAFLMNTKAFSLPDGLCSNARTSTRFRRKRYHPALTYRWQL